MKHFIFLLSVCSACWLATGDSCFAIGGACGGAACAPCGTACSPCGVDSCGPGISSCKFLYAHCGPPREPCIVTGVRGVLAAFGFHCCGCEDGCGEKYWGDWCSDPPDCWDPCDCNGNFVGGCSGPPVYAPGLYAGPLDGMVQKSPRPVAPQTAGARQIANTPKTASVTETVATPVQAPQAAPKVMKAGHATAQARRIPIRR